MGSGKTVTGRVLARKLGTAFVDTDQLIEKEAGIPVREIFATFGEPHFREIEREVIKKISKESGIVIAVGGGSIVNPANMTDLKKHGIIVTLKAAPETILSRVDGNSDRPLLQVDDKIGKIKEMLAGRAPFYEQADIAVNTDVKTPEQVADEIVKSAQITGYK